MNEETEEEPPTQAEEVPQRRSGRRLWWLLAIPPLLLIGLLAVLAVLPWLARPAFVGEQITSRGTEALGAPVSLERFDYHPFWGLVLEGLRVGPPEGYAEPLLTLKRLELRYRLAPLLSGRFELVTFELDSPRVVLEEVAGRRNLDVVLEKLSGPPKEAPESEPKEPSTGPLSPIDVLIEKIAVKNAAFEMSGGGQFFRLDGLNLDLSGGLEANRLALRLGVHMSPVRSPANVQVSLPVTPFDLDLALGLSVSATVAGSARDGLSLGSSGLRLGVVLDPLTFKNTSSVPPVEARLSAEVSLSPERDRVGLEHLRFDLLGAPVLTAKAELDGLFRGLEQALGTGAGAALATTLGVPGPKGPGMVRLDLSSLRISLDRLLPYLRFARPRLEASGELEVGPVLASGTVAELMASAPAKLEVPIAFRDLSVHEPEMEAQLGLMKGALRFFRDEAEDRPYRLTGGLALDRIVFSVHELGHLELGLSSRFERLLYPDLGFTELGLTAAARRIRSPPASLDAAEVGVQLVGPDLFLPERNTPVPAQLTVKTKLSGISAEAGADRVAVRTLEDDLAVELDRLLTPARRPIQIKNQLRLSGLEVPTQSLKSDAMSLGLEIDVDDPRSHAALDVKASSKLRIKGLSRAPLVAADIELDLGLGVNGQPITPGVEPLPNAVSVDSKLRLPRLSLSSPELGAIETKAELSLETRARPQAGRVDRMKLKLAADDLLQLEATGAARRILSPRPELELKLKLSPLSVEKLIARIPSEMADQVPVTQGSGEVDLSLFFSGPLPDAAKISEELTRLPFVFDAQLGLKSVSLLAPSQNIRLEGLEGRIGAEARAGRLMATAKLDVGELERSDPKAPVTASDVAARVAAGFSEGRWAVDFSTVLGAVEAPGQATGPIRGAAVELSAHHPLFGGVELERLSLQAAELGVRVDAKGRLERRLYGALRPVLEVSSSVDFDRLRKVLPELPPVSGRMGFDLDLKSPTDELLELSGQLDLARLGYEMQKSEPKPLRVTVQNVEGRLPFQQKLRLSPPLAGNLEARPGALGDDLEQRLQELTTDLTQRSYVVVECRDVLQTDPKVAGYEALRPYRTRQGARLTIEKIGYNEQSIDNMSFDILYGGGVLRLDRFALQLFEGDIFGSFALQLAGRDSFRVRLQTGITDLNMDVPFSRARGLPPISNPGEKEPYLMSGNMDLQLDSKSRSLDGSVDLTKLGPELFVRIIDALDPNGEDAQLQKTRSQLSTWMGFLGRDIVGVSLEGMKIDIKHNLLSMQFDWYRPWFDVHATSAGGTPWLPRLWLPATQLLFGTAIVSTVPEIKRYSLSPYMGALEDANRQLSGLMTRPIVTEGCEKNGPDLAGLEP